METETLRIELSFIQIQFIRPIALFIAHKRLSMSGNVSTELSTKL